MQSEAFQRFGSSKQVSEQELMEARACLTLLKQKMRADPPKYFTAEPQTAASNYRKAFKPTLAENPSQNPAPMKKPTYNAKESSKGFSKYDFETMEEAGPDSTETALCPDCGRSFNVGSLQKHVKICKKVFQNKRKSFNSAEQRQTEDSLPVHRTENRAKPKGSAKWKNQSEHVRANAKAARYAEAGDSEGARKAAAVAAEHERKLLTPCPHCGRTFNEEAAQRHIPICEKKARAAQFQRGKARGVKR